MLVWFLLINRIWKIKYQLLNIILSIAVPSNAQLCLFVKAINIVDRSDKYTILHCLRLNYDCKKFYTWGRWFVLKVLPKIFDDDNQLMIKKQILVWCLLINRIWKIKYQLLKIILRTSVPSNAQQCFFAKTISIVKLTFLKLWYLPWIVISYAVYYSCDCIHNSS
jgi:hypothetical protein